MIKIFINWFDYQLQNINAKKNRYDFKKLLMVRWIGALLMIKAILRNILGNEWLFAQKLYFPEVYNPNEIVFESKKLTIQSFAFRIF